MYIGFNMVCAFFDQLLYQKNNSNLKMIKERLCYILNLVGVLRRLFFNFPCTFHNNSEKEKKQSGETNTYLRYQDFVSFVFS